QLAAMLRAKRFETALLLQNAFDAAWVVWRAGIPQRVGYDRDGRGILLTKAIRVPKIGEIPAHERFYYLELLRRAGWLDALPDAPEIALQMTTDDTKRAEEKLRQLGARGGATRIAVGAGASYGSAKCWPPERFAQALNHLQRERDVEIV